MIDRRTGLAIVAVAVTGAVLAGYYWVHKPVTPPQALALGRTAANIGVAAVLTVLAGAAGRRLLSGRAPAGEVGLEPGERATLDVALGWGLGGLALLALGLARLYYGLVVWALVVLGLVALRREAQWWARDVAAAIRAVALPDRPARLAAAFVLLMLALGLLRALAPPVMWDALVYHLTLPKLYAQTHGVRLAPADFSHFAGMPQISEMLYTAAGLLRGDLAGEGAIAAQTLGWAFGAVLALSLISLAQATGLPGAWAGALLLSSFTVALSLAWAYGDLPLVLFAAAMLMSLRRWRLQPRPNWLVLAGVFGGLAWGCKYTGVLVPVAGAAAAATLALQQRPERAGWLPAARASAALLVAAGVTFAPWLFKNWLFTGSPVYPLAWPAGDVDALRQWFYNRPDLAERSPLALAVFVRATFLGVQGGNQYDITLGPLYLLLPSLLLLAWGKLPVNTRRDLLPLVVFGLVGYAGWVAMTMYSALATQARLFFAILPALALLGAAGLAAARQLDTPSLRLSVVMNSVVGLVLVLSGLEVTTHFVSQNPLAYLAGLQSASDYRAARLGWYEPTMARINALPEGSRVVMLWETRSLACGAHLACDPDVVIDRWWHLRRTLGSAPAILAQWRAAEATHVLIYDAGARFVAADGRSPLEPADWSELDQLRAQLRLVEDFGSVYSLYAIP
jgi:hypothetical protein